MRLYTTTFNGDAPAAKQIQTPTNSKFGFSFAFKKDGAEWTPDVVTLDGNTPDDVLSSGYVFRRESGPHAGLQIHDVVALDQAVSASEDAVVSVYNSRPAPINMPVYSVKLSTLIDKDIEVTYDQFGLIDRYGSSQEGVLSAEWHDVQGVQTKIYPYLSSSPFYSRYQGEFSLYESSGTSKTNKVLLTPAGRIEKTAGIPGRGTSWTEVSVDIDVPEVKRVFALNERTVDMGVCEGYVDAAELSSKVSAAANGNAPLPSTLQSVYESDWVTISATADPNTVYIVLPEPE